MPTLPAVPDNPQAEFRATIRELIADHLYGNWPLLFTDGFQYQVADALMDEFGDRLIFADALADAISHPHPYVDMQGDLRFVVEHLLSHIETPPVHEPDECPQPDAQVVIGDAKPE